MIRFTNNPVSISRQRETCSLKEDMEEYIKLSDELHHGIGWGNEHKLPLLNDKNAIERYRTKRKTLVNRILEIITDREKEDNEEMDERVGKKRNTKDNK